MGSFLSLMLMYITLTVWTWLAHPGHKGGTQGMFVECTNEWTDGWKDGLMATP